MLQGKRCKHYNNVYIIYLLVGVCLLFTCAILCQFVLIASSEHFLDCRIGKFFMKSHHTKIVVDQFILEKKDTLQTTISIIIKIYVVHMNSICRTNSRGSYFANSFLFVTQTYSRCM